MSTPLVRLIVIGESGVGKTQMMFQFTENSFQSDSLTTVGVDFKAKTIVIEGVAHKIQIWDTAGQERFRNITEAYYRKGHGIAIVYDVSHRDTFTTLPTWFDAVRSKCEGLGPIPIVLIGNKSDLEPAVSMEEGFQLAQEHDVHFFQTSAKDGSNIEEAFTDLATQAAKVLAEKDKGGAGGEVELASGKGGKEGSKKKGFSC
jgi:small GTP-binding protein